MSAVGRPSVCLLVSAHLQKKLKYLEFVFLDGDVVAKLWMYIYEG